MKIVLCLLTIFVFSAPLKAKAKKTFDYVDVREIAPKLIDCQGVAKILAIAAHHQTNQNKEGAVPPILNANSQASINYLAESFKDEKFNYIAKRMLANPIVTDFIMKLTIVDENEAGQLFDALVSYPADAPIIDNFDEHGENARNRSVTVSLVCPKFSTIK